MIRIRKVKLSVGDLYQLIFSDGKSYIGACTCGAENRYKVHCGDATYGSHLPVHDAWRRLGAPVLVVLERGLVKEQLWVAEKRTIKNLKTKVPFGYNSRYGSDKPHGRFGKKLPKNTKELMSAKAILRFLDPKEREKIGKPQRGKTISEDSKKKNRQAHLGKKLLEDTKRKIGKANLGKTRTPEVKAQMGVSQKRRFADPEQREKSRDAANAQWEQYRKEGINPCSRKGVRNKCSLIIQDQ